jgi:hypothetical protein
VALPVSPQGAVCAFGLAGSASDEGPIGDFLNMEAIHDAYP